jgi:hypothetical protein
MLTSDKDKDTTEDRHKEFQQKFEAHIEDSEKYKQYVRSTNYHEWNGTQPYNLDVKVVPMKSIHLTIDNLERLVRQQEFIENLERDAEYGKKVVNMLRADERVRDDNPAVAKAYRNYLILLELARK